MSTPNASDKISIKPSHAVRRRIVTFIIMVFGFLLVVPLNSYRALQVINNNYNLLDGSWVLELPARLGQGEIAGRDFIFTYGPLWQAIEGLGLVIPPGDLASIMRFRGLLGALLTMLCIWFLLGLTHAPLKWRATFYLLWAVFWPMGLVKPMAGLLAVAVCGHVLEQSGKNLFNRWGKLVLPWGISVPILLLYAFDLGVMTGISLLVLAAALLLFVRIVKTDFSPMITRQVLLGVAVLTSSLLLMALILHVSGWSRFLRDSLDLASGYQLTLALGIGRRDLAKVGLALSLCSLTLALITLRIGSAWRSGSKASAADLTLFSSLFFCIVFTRYGLTRSDGGHVFFSLSPTIFVLGCLLPCYARAKELRYTRPILIVSLLAFLLSPLGMIPAVARSLLRRLAAVPTIEFSGARLEVRNDLLRNAAAAAGKLQSAALYVWPHETIINLVAGKRNPSYALQNYATTTDQLQLATVRALESTPDLPVLFMRNGGGLDGVEDLTRTPHIFRYLLAQYELDDSSEQFVILQRRSEGGLRWQEEVVAVTPISFSPQNEPLRATLGSDIDCRVSDLLVLSLRASKTRFYGLGKPGRFYLSFLLSNGERRVQNILLPPDGKSHDVLVSGCTVRDPLFLSLFGSQRLWRSSERVVEVQLNWDRLDRLSFRPARVTLERIVILRRESAELLETLLAEQDKPEFWNWCYEGAFRPAFASSPRK